MRMLKRALAEFVFGGPDRNKPSWFVNIANNCLKLDGIFKALLLRLVNLFLEQKALPTGKPSSNFNYFRELKLF